MSIIYRKVWRDLWRNKTRTVLAMLSTAVGILALGMVVSMSDLMTGRMTGEWLASQPAYVTVSIIGGSVDSETATTLKRTSGVTEIEPALYTTIHWKHVGETDWRNANLIARQDYGQQKLDIVRLTSGTWPRATLDSVAVEGQSVSAYNAPLDSQIIFKTSTDERKMTIVGVVHDVSAPNPTLAGDASFYITPNRLQDILGQEGYNQLKVRMAAYSKNGANTVGNQLKLHLEKMGLTVGTPQIHDPQRHYLQDNIDALLLIMTVLGILSLGLSVFLIANTINAVLAHQISQIGIMKSVGATTGRVMRVYMIMVLAYGLLAVLVAVPLAALGANALAQLLLTVLNVESVSTQLVPRAVVIQLAVGLLAPTFAALWPVLGGARTTVRQAIASYGLGANFGAGLIDRLIARVRGLPRPLALSLRNTFRHKGRVALTQITLIIAGVMFIGVMSVASTLSYTLVRLFNVYGFDVWLNLDHPQRFERIDAVADSIPSVIGTQVFASETGTLEMTSERKRDVLFLGLPFDSPMYRPAITAGRWFGPDDQNVMVVNQSIARDEGLKVGDRVTVKFNQEEHATWEIIGLMFDIAMRQNQVLVPRDTLTRVLRQTDQGNMVWVKTDRHAGDYQAAIEKQLRAAFDSNSMSTNFSITSARNKQVNANLFGVITNLLLAMSVLAGLVGSIGLMGTMSINVLERSKEIGVMRAIGARSSTIAGIFVGEGVILALLSTLIAIPLSYPLSRLFSLGVGMAIFKLPLDFSYSTASVFIWLMLLTVLSALASLLPALRAARISIRETLAYE